MFAAPDRPMVKKLLPLAWVAIPAWTASGAELAIEEVVVTASRIGSVDQRVVVMDDDEVDEAFIHAADALRVLPGVALSTNGHRGSLTQVRVRGAESNHLLVLLDGVALNDPALGSEFNFGALDFAGIQRVEYLAGPRSAIWGSDALAGVLYLDTTPRRDLSTWPATDVELDAYCLWRGSSISPSRPDGSSSSVPRTCSARNTQRSTATAVRVSPPWRRSYRPMTAIKRKRTWSCVRVRGRG